MVSLSTVVWVTLVAGLAMPFGAFIANIENVKPQWLEDEIRHLVMAFGAGALLSAVSLVLVPEGVVALKPLAAAAFFLAGGLSFMALDILLTKIATPASQLAAMLADFIPESIALGAAFVTGSNSAYLLAGLIALQNLPEGFNAFRELKDSSKFRPFKIILLFASMALLGPIAGSIGYLYLADSTTTISAIMLFASGGILYSIFQDIAPQVKLEKHWLPSMGAVLGFMFGMVGQMFV